MQSFAKPTFITPPVALSRPRLSPLKWSRWPIALQMGISFAFAITLVLLAFAVIPEIATTGKQQLTLANHESGHAVGVLIQLGEVEEIRLRANGSGEVVSRANDPVLSAGMGLLLPPLIAVICIMLGATRTGVEITLMLMCIPLFWLGYAHADIPTVRYALWGWGLFALFFTIPGIPHTLKSAALMVFGLVLMVGIYDGLGYLAAETVPDQNAAAQALGLGTTTTPAPLRSDVRIIADAFQAGDIDGVRICILFMMGAMAFVALSTIYRFLIIHRTR